MHIKYLIKNNKYSPIISLYDDEEVCQIVDCNFFKSIQLIERPANIYKNYNKYSELFRKYTYEYIFENKMTAEETIKSIYELTKSIKNEGSSLELVISIIIITASVVMLLLLFCLLNNKYIFYFKFLPRDFWVIVIIGLIITMSPFFTKLGELNSMKCYFKYILFFFGSTLYMKPLLYKLIINIPEKNVKLLTWISKNRYIFLLFLILIDTILYGLLGLSSFDIENKIHNDTINFKICKMKRTIGKIMIIILYTLKFIEIILGLFLIFIEWNLKLTYYDLRFVVIFFYINILYFIFIIITNSLRIDDYNFNLALPEFVNIFFTVLNYIILYGFRIISTDRSGDRDSIISSQIRNDDFYMSNNSVLVTSNCEINKNENINKNINENTINNTNMNENAKNKTNINEKSKNNKKILSFYRKIYNYHYRTSKDLEDIILKTDAISRNYSATFD